MSSKYQQHQQISSNFQRSQSKVWWSDFDTIQEKKSITTSWLRQGSPSSHKSQDSGFSDTEMSSPPLYNQLNQKNETKNLLNKENNSPDKLTPKKSFINNQIINEESAINQRTPTSPVTPPTVIRRHDYENQPILLNRENVVSRRISFSAPSSPVKTMHLTGLTETFDFVGQIESFNYSSTSPNMDNINSSQDDTVNSSIEIKEDLNNNKIEESPSSLSKSNCKCEKDRSIKRGRTISRSSSKFSRNLSETHLTPKVVVKNEEEELSDDDEIIQPKKSILKKSVKLESNEENNNNCTVRSLEEIDDNQEQPIRTSTPKPYRNNFMELSQSEHHHDDPPKCVQNWLSELRHSYHHEVLSTLQTKSIALEAGRNLKVTSAIAAKLIRSTQSRVMVIQQEFEKLEKMCANHVEVFQISIALQSITNLLIEFMEKQKNRASIYCEIEHDFKQFEDNINNVIEMSIDLRVASTKFDEFDVDLIKEDVIVLKRYVLITVRTIFEKLVKIVINSIEDNRCELILRSSLSTLSMLSNIEYSGFASLNSSFLANDTVKVLLIQILDSKLSSIRALALRALATICSTHESIKQFERCGGLELLKEIMVDQDQLRLEPELRETVSVLTQLTAPWHGDNHKIKGLKDCVECFVEAITELLSKTNCCQTLLLCAACLNNLSRIEPTSIYSLMSHESISKLQKAVNSRGPGASIFLFEQITSMLLNMSTNKKCHNHLSNKTIINFITKIFQTKFYEKFDSQSESSSQKKTIKNILYIISHLIHESIINPEVLENDVLPIFTKIENNHRFNSDSNSKHLSCYSNDIIYLNKKLNESLTYKNNHVALFKNCNVNVIEETVSSSSSSKNNNDSSNITTITKKRYESFV